MPRKKKEKPEEPKKPKVNKQLDGLDINVNSFGEIQVNYDIDKINTFLNKNVDDKKLRDRDDVEKENDKE